MTNVSEVTVELEMDEDDAMQLLSGLEAAIDQKVIPNIVRGLELLAAGKVIRIKAHTKFKDWKGLYGRDDV